MNLRYFLQRHPIPMQAWFRHSLVLTYALPAPVLEPLLSPGLILDTSDGFGFLAIALVDTQGMRPRGLPARLGIDSRLAGYRLFTRLAGGRSLRGLRILRSDTDRSPVSCLGNLLTHYHYHHSCFEVSTSEDAVRWNIRTKHHSADLEVTASLATPPANPPAGSPFATWREARRFAGPLPYTFDYEAETNSIVRIEGVRRNWTPRPVAVDIRRCAFLDQFPQRPQLANAFFVSSIPYEWKRGVREVLCSPSFD